MLLYTQYTVINTMELKYCGAETALGLQLPLVAQSLSVHGVNKDLSQSSQALQLIQKIYTQNLPGFITLLKGDELQEKESKLNKPLPLKTFCHSSKCNRC